MTVAPTVDLADAGKRPWDVIVVGAGPAGALAARQLALRGVSVLLVDKASFPRSKVCGACLNPVALETLAALGLFGLVKNAIPLDSMRLATEGRQAIIPFLGWKALSRETLDSALVKEAIYAGAAFLPETRARLLPPSSASCRQVFLRQERDETLTAAQLVLAAGGLTGKSGEVDCRSRPNSRVGAGVVVDEGSACYSSGAVFMACGKGGYVGLVRLEDGRLNVAAALDPGALRKAGGLGKAAQAILTKAGFPPVNCLTSRDWKGTPLLTRQVRFPAGSRLLAVGDAAGFEEPFTGDGIGWALASAALVAPIAFRACRHWDHSLARDWASLHYREICRRQWLCRVLANVLRRPALARLTIAVLARAPILAGPVTRCLNRGPILNRPSRNPR